MREPHGAKTQTRHILDDGTFAEPLRVAAPVTAAGAKIVRTRDAPGSPAAAELAERNPWVLAAVCACCCLSTILAFRPALDKDFGFVNYDDNRYVYDNEHVTQGLTRDSIAWAFTSLEYDNWHPLTWLSHMLDRQIFGPESFKSTESPGATTSRASSSTPSTWSCSSWPCGG